MDDYRGPCGAYGVVKSMHHAGKRGESAAIAKLLVLPSSRPHPAIQKQLKIVVCVCQACPGREGQSTKILEKELLTPRPGPYLSHCTSLLIFTALFCFFFPETSSRSLLIYANSSTRDSYMNKLHMHAISVPFFWSRSQSLSF